MPFRGPPISPSWNVYNLVCIWESNEWKTALIIPTSYCESLVMHFDFCNSPTAFQNHYMLGRFEFAYLVDILVYSHSWHDYIQHVGAILQRLLSHQLFCKLEN